MFLWSLKYNTADICRYIYSDHGKKCTCITSYTFTVQFAACKNYGCKFILFFFGSKIAVILCIDLKDVNGKDVNGEITFAAMVPMQVYNTLQVPEERERLTHIRHLIIGGGAIDASLEKELQALPGNIAIWSTYGMTETLSHIALRRINGDEASEWYQPFDSVKISQTEEGCLVIDAPLVCAETLVTNDIVEIEPYIYNKVEKTRFRIKGRKDNVICSGGIKIQIEEVEEFLKPHLEKPFMLAKKKDEKFGEIAVLLTEDEDLKKVEATIRRLLSDHKYWIPREFLHVDHLPLTETGKPKRAILL